MTLVAWDCETSMVQPGLLTPPIVCHSFQSEDSAFEGLVTPGSGFQKLRYLLQGGYELALANGAYDFGCLLAEYPQLFKAVWDLYEAGKVHDVLIAATLVAISQGRLHDGALYDIHGQKMKDDKGRQTKRYSLYNTTLEWTGRNTAKANDRFRLSYALLRGIPIEKWPADAQQYPKDDAVNTFDDAKAQLESGFDFTDLPLQCHAAFCAHLAAVNGMRTDPERVAKLEADLKAKYDVLHDWAVKQGLYKLKTKTKPQNGYSKDTKKLQEMVTKAYLGTPPKTDGGGISTSRQTYEESGDKVLEKFAEISAIEKDMSYLPTLKEAARVPLNVKPNILLSTGRASYEGMLQLMPREGGQRECFKARGTYVSVDYNAVELSTLAQVCLWTVGRSKLADAINAGIDPHCMMGANLNGMTYEEFFKGYKSGDEILSDLRQAAKAANFGFPGMMGPVTFVISKRKEGNSVCEWLHRDGRCGEEKCLSWKGRQWDGGPLCVRCIEESAKLKKTYLGTWDEMPEYFHWITNKLEFSDTITQFVSNRIRGGVNAPQAANTLFQGLAADGAKRAVIAMTKEMYMIPESPLYSSRLCIFAHDETIIDVPNNKDLHDAGYRQRDIMVNELQKICPDVKVSAEPAAMIHWTKKSKPRHDEKGRLIAWDS